MIDQYIRQYGKRLYGLCLTLCADPFQADDLYQDTWLKILRHYSRYDPKQDFEPWLTTVCVNTYRSALRRIARSPFLQFSSTEEHDQVLSAVPAPENADYTDLHAAINHLPEKLRLAVILFYFRDMDINSVAQILNIPAGTVKSRLNTARKRLKEVLTDETDLQF